MEKKKQPAKRHAGLETPTGTSKGSTGSSSHSWGIKPSAPPGEQMHPALHSLEEELKKWQDHISDDDPRQIRKAIEELMNKYL
jgi:hypothetical protein